MFVLLILINLMHPVNSSKPVRPVDVRKPIRPVNSNNIVRTVNFNKPGNSKIVRPVNSIKPVRRINVRKSARPVNSNKPVYPIDVCKSVPHVDVCKPVCVVDIRKPSFVDYWRHAVLLLILLFFVVSVNIHMTYLIFTKFFKCTYVILTDYILFIAGRLFKYLFLGIFIICRHFFKLLLIEFVMNFAFINIFYINNVSLDVDNVKTINSMFSLTIMAEDIVSAKLQTIQLVLV